MNIIMLSGRIVKDIVLRSTQSGKEVVSNKIAVDVGYGENKKTYFFNFVAWGSNAKFLNSYAAKGDKIVLNGYLTERQYTNKDGVTQYVTEIITDSIELMAKKQSNSGSNDDAFSAVSDDDFDLPF